MKDVPFAGAKMSLFEGIARAYLYTCASYGIKRSTNNGDTIQLTGAAALTPVESGFVGFISGMLDIIKLLIFNTMLMNFSLAYLTHYY